MREGAALLSFVWFQVAQRVLETAVQVYELTPEQTEALRKIFLRPGDYSVQPL
jgi:hypothetical protein